MRRIFLRLPISFVNSFGLKSSLSQSLAWKGALTAKALKVAGLVGSAPPPCSAPAVANGSQLVGLRVKFGPVHRQVDRADVELGAAEDVRDRVGDGVDLRRFGVDEQRHPHHDRAEVIRPGRGGGDHCQGERSPVVGA